jgi:hypothetical protein
MKVALINGKLTIDGNEVSMVVFADNKAMRFPIESSEELVVENGVATAIGKNNMAITGKNINTGNVTCKGDFRLGDG